MCIPETGNMSSADGRIAAVSPFSRRKPEAAVFWWSSSRSLLIVKGDDAVELKPDDVAALANFMRGCSVGPQPL